MYKVVFTVLIFIVLLKYFFVYFIVLLSILCLFFGKKVLEAGEEDK